MHTTCITQSIYAFIYLFIYDLFNESANNSVCDWADPSSREVLATVMCHYVWATNFKNAQAMARFGLLRQKKNVKSNRMIISK